MKHQTITKENIRTMLDRFYSAVLQDELIANFFIQKLDDEMISDEWQHHLDLLTNFWASIILNDTTYSGQAVKPHIRMKGLKRESFERWLKLFFQTVDKFYEKDAADTFKYHSKHIADNFMQSLKL